MLDHVSVRLADYNRSKKFYMKSILLVAAFTVVAFTSSFILY